MSGEALWPWLALLGLGAVHGINPGMGWLFAVALGLQERDGRAVWRALPALAAGHALAIAAVVGAAALIGLVLPLPVLKWLAAGVLLGFGLYKLVRNRHPRWLRMRVGAKELTAWSFLMASAHGAGLMVLPFVLAGQGRGHVSHAAGHHGASAGSALAGLPSDQGAALLATLLHTAGYLLVTGVVALVVYRKLGLRLLRSVWLNLDLVWAAALIVTALLTPLL